MGRHGPGGIKCAVTGCPNQSKTNPEIFKTYLQTQNIQYKNQALSILHQNKPYTYLGIQLVPSLKWKLQTHVTTTKVINQCNQLTTCLATIKQKISMVDTVIRAGIAYSFYAVPYSLPTIKKTRQKNHWDPKNNLWTAQMHSQCHYTVATWLIWTWGFFFKNTYLRCIGEQLRNALNDPGRLGKIYQGLIQYILAKYGGAEQIPRIKYHDCVHSPTTRTLFLFKKAGRIHLKSTNQNLQLYITELESEWMTQASTILPHLNSKTSFKLLHKLLLHNISNIKHITLPNDTQLMSPT